MKKIIEFIIVLVTCFLSFKSYGQYYYQINGVVNNAADSLGKNNIKDGDQVVLKFLNMSRSDTCYIHGNTFKFSGSVPYPSIAMIEYKYGDVAINLDNSTYTCYLTLKKINDKLASYDPELKTNSPFFNTFDQFRSRRVDLNVRKSKFQNELQKTQNKDSVLYYNTLIKTMNDSLIIAYEDLARKYPNSYIVAYVYPNIPDFSYEKYIGMYNAFPDSIRNTYYAKNFYSRLMASKALKNNSDDNKEMSLDKNTELPLIAGIDTSFKKMVLDKSFYKQHRYTLIDFWASWCVPCRIVTRDLKAMKTALDKKEICIVGFSLDKSGEAWKAALMEDKTNWLQISDLKATDSPIVNFLNIEAIPYNIIVNSEGKIVARNLRNEKLTDFLNSK